MPDMVKQTEQNKDPFFVKYIKQRIDQNKNFVCLISGQTGSGKSWSALSCAEMLDPHFKISQVIFRGTELLSLINSGKIKRGSVIIWDEAGIDLSNRAWQSATNKLLNFLFQTFRHKGYILFFTTPYSDFVDKLTRRLFHCEIKTVSIDFKNRTTRVKPQLMQYNSRFGKFYYKYLRVNMKGGGVMPLTDWNIPAPSNELIDAYEKKKTEFTTKLNQEIEEELNKVEGKKKKERNGEKEKQDFIVYNEIEEDVKGKKPLTQLQMQVLMCWKRGIFSNKEIAKKMGKKIQRIPEYTKAMRKKGYYQERYMGGGL